MAADYAGAIAAIKQRFVDNWKSGSDPLTPFSFVNDPLPVTSDSEGKKILWVLFEVVSLGSYLIGSGQPGNNVIVYDGLIKGYVFAPTGAGTGEADGGAIQKALAIGEIYRNKLFFDGVTAGCFVRSGYDLQGQPRIDDGVAQSSSGEWFNVTATIPFEYWHRG